MKKNLFSVLALIQITLLLFAPIYYTKAIFSSFGGKIRKGIKDFLTKDLLIDNNDLGIGQLSQKPEVPEVIIKFTKIDETHYKATAVPKGISNPNEAYYTWYIKNPDTRLRGFNPLGTLPLADQIGSAGANPNDPDFWKVMATRENIKYHFNPMRYDSTFNGGDGNFILSNSEYPFDSDNDGYKATVGGDNAQNGTKYCYLFDNNGGDVYELMAGGDDNSGVDCPAGFSATCMEADRISCPDPNDPASTKLFDICEEEEPPVCVPSLGTSRPLCPDGGLPSCIINSSNINPICPMVGDPNPKSCNDLVVDGIIVPAISCNANMVFSNNPRLNNACDEDKIHLFPFPNNEAKFGVSFESGDDDFGNEEERFWGTDPENDNTVDDILDEELIVGKGMSTFIWEYHEGDEIGVVVEGIGAATRHENRSEQTIYAFMQGGCKPVDTASYLEKIRGSYIKILTADMDRNNLNDCISNNTENFTSPGGRKEELDLDVKITGPTHKLIPKDPAKFITFDSVLSHKGSDKDVSTERHNTNFEWFIEHSHSKYSGFTLETNRTFLQNQFGILNSEGIGVDSFTMSQNFPNSWFATSTNLTIDQTKDKGWVKITLRANAPSARGDVSRFGQTSYLFQITNSGTTPLSLSVAQPTDATGTGYQRQLNICTGANEHLNCEVLVNQVIRVSLPSVAMTSKNTLWKVNGKSVFCNEFISPECTPDNPSVIYVPIVKDVDTYEITATLSELGTVEASHNLIPAEIAATIEFNATLNKVTPELILLAGGSAVELERGIKKDLDGGSVTEISNNLFTVPRGGAVTVTSSFIPSFLNGGLGTESHLEWYINSTQQNLTDVPSVSFASERDVRVKANGFYDISNLKRLALKNIYGITADISGRTFFDESVKVEMIDSGAFSKTAPSNKIFATISQNSPMYIMFLLKMIFMIGIMLFIPSVILNLSKKSN